MKKISAKGSAPGLLHHGLLGTDQFTELLAEPGARVDLVDLHMIESKIGRAHV